MKINGKSWNIILLYVIIICFLLVYGFKTLSIYRFNNDNWEVFSVNYGFAIVTNGDNKVLVRNPTPDIQEGDKVIVKGFDYNGVPYIYSEIKE